MQNPPIDPVLRFLRQQSEKLKAMNQQLEVQSVIEKTQEFVEEYIAALYSPHFPDVKIPLFPSKTR